MIPGRLLPNRVALHLGGGQGPFGPIPGERRVVRALVEGSNRTVQASDGSEVVSDTRVYLDPVVVDHGSEVTIFVGKPEETTRRVVRVAQFRAPGRSHTVLDLN